jgi:hypothetical protein
MDETTKNDAQNEEKVEIKPEDLPTTPTTLTTVIAMSQKRVHMVRVFEKDGESFMEYKDAPKSKLVRTIRINDGKTFFKPTGGDAVKVQL